jgi:hypothetical protein
MIIHDLKVDDLVIDISEIFARIPTMIITEKDEEETDDGETD